MRIGGWRAWHVACSSVPRRRTLSSATYRRRGRPSRSRGIPCCDPYSSCSVNRWSGCGRWIPVAQGLAHRRICWPRWRRWAPRWLCRRRRWQSGRTRWCWRSRGLRSRWTLLPSAVAYMLLSPHRQSRTITRPTVICCPLLGRWLVKRKWFTSSLRTTSTGCSMRPSPTLWITRAPARS